MIWLMGRLLFSEWYAVTIVAIVYFKISSVQFCLFVDVVYSYPYTREGLCPTVEYLYNTVFFTTWWYITNESISCIVVFNTFNNVYSDLLILGL